MTTLMYCYVPRTITLKLGDKYYSTPAVIMDVGKEQAFEHLIGMDFIQNHQLTLEWMEGELYISDKKGLFHKLKMRKPHPSASQGLPCTYTEVDATAPQEGLKATAPPPKKKRFWWCC